MIALVGIAAFAFCYAGVLATLAGQWWSNTIYTYGFLIPVISGYLVWLERDRLRLIPPAPAGVAGTALLLAGLGILLFANAGGMMIVQEASLLVTLCGLILLVLGPTWLRHLLFPVGYLAFMLPAWDALTDRLHGPFQMFSASGGVALLQLLGVPVSREGTLIRLPTITLVVAKVCSGVNYLIAVVAIGIPLAHISFRDWPRRFLLIAIGVAIAILSNTVRVALIGILVQLGIAGDLHGPYHVLQGLFVSVVGFAALFAAAALLSRGERARPGAGSARPSESSTAAPHPFRLPAWALLWASALLVAAGLAIHFRHPSPTPLARDLATLPTQAGPWTGHDEPPDSTLQRAVRPDLYLSRVYATSDGRSIRFYVGYRAYQTQGRELVNDRTGHLHSGTSPRSITVAKDAPPLDVRWRVERDPAGSRVTLFWYTIGDRTTANRLAAQCITAWNAMAHGSSAGALTLVTADLAPGEDAPGVLLQEEDLLRRLYPELELCFRRR